MKYCDLVKIVTSVFHSVNIYAQNVHITGVVKNQHDIPVENARLHLKKNSCSCCDNRFSWMFTITGAQIQKTTMPPAMNQVFFTGSLLHCANLKSYRTILTS